MTFSITCLVLLAALMHAGWNAVLRGGADRFWSMTIMCLATAIACLAAIPFLPMPQAPAWPYAILSGALHVVYMALLVRTYRSGDLGQTYPIARGSSPVLVALGAAVLGGEHVGPLALFGILLVSGGIMSLAFSRRVELSSLPFAFATGCSIGAYSVCDGLGVRVAGSAAAYTVWMCLIESLVFPLIYFAWRGRKGFWRGARETSMAAAGGVVSLLAYGIVILAMQLGPMGPVSATRETSVVFAAILGRMFLGEVLTARRVIACAVIAAGVICIG